jgi:benzoyl-CoA reductase/2-hydroxyglutaryl-CoA dehydratase subunit BcrC/BadD/HgdB
MAEIPTADGSSINAAAERFERAWKNGERPRIEESLIIVAEPQRPQLFQELIKVVIGQQIVEQPGVFDRFIREIRAVVRLRHPNVVSAYSAFRCGTGAFTTCMGMPWSGVSTPGPSIPRARRR